MNVEPWGERRSDLREAINTVAAAENSGMVKFTADGRRELLQALMTYLGIDKPEEKIASQKMIGQMFGE